MIPAFDADTMHLPPGRHACTLTDIEASLVDSPQFAGSTTRRELFSGLVQYLTEWELIWEDLASAEPFLRCVWIGGSFASAEPHPNDIDVSPLVDARLMDTYRGRPGYGRIKKLLKHRPSIMAKYRIDVFPILWHPVVHILNEDTWDNDHRAYVTDRGRFDDFWQRCRHNGSDVPSEESCVSRRGYLEVHL